ncbi:MAG: hypothetical protein K1X38_03755 [Microthrixaceae bacterium]|nr:hypothetical protein [Microthrixaceae bacterium]
MTAAADEFESVYVAAPVELRESIGRAVLRALINVSLHRSMDVRRWSDLIGAESLEALITRKALTREEIAERNRTFQHDVWPGFRS